MKEMIFAAFIPHRDCKKQIEVFKHSLFSLGFYGAYSFPIASPLALLSRELTRDELKKTAALLRESTFAENRRITAGAWSLVTLGALCFGGQRLNLPVDAVLSGAVVERCAFPLLVEAIVNGTPPAGAPAGIKDKTPPPFFFTAGYAANLTLTPLNDDGYSFEWRISCPAWLPKHPPHAPYPRS